MWRKMSANHQTNKGGDIIRPYPSPLFNFNLRQHILGKFLGLAAGCDRAVGDRRTEFSVRGAIGLRGREVLLQSGGAPHGDGAPHTDQLARAAVQDLFILVVEKLLAYFHVFPLTPIPPGFWRSSHGFCRSFLRNH